MAKLNPNPAASPQWPTLRAVFDRIIPRDEHPSACDAGADRHAANVLSGEAADRWPTIQTGLALLDEAAISLGGVFVNLPESSQDRLLTMAENGNLPGNWPIPPSRWLRMMCDLTAEGYFGDPGTGGNIDRAGWRMIGYDPGVGGSRW